MSSVLYSIRSDAEFEGATVTFPSGDTFPVASDHPKYAQIVEALLGKKDEKTIFSLVAPFDSVFLNLTALSDRVSRKGTTLYFDGDPINSGIATEIVKSLDAEGFAEGKTWRAYVNFLERLMTNPSVESRDHFYKYVETHGLTITPEGMVVLYKGVERSNNKGVYQSVHSGYGHVTDDKGKTTIYENANLPNAVGYVVSIPRSKVDTERSRHCSTGLHAGTFAYAKSFAPVLLTVLVDPRDVVSVPSDHNNAKVRVSRYKVIEVNDQSKAYESGVVKTKAEKPNKAESRVGEYEKVIKALRKDQGFGAKELRRFRGKSVTAGRRGDFTQAAKNLGIDLDA